MKKRNSHAYAAGFLSKVNKWKSGNEDWQTLASKLGDLKTFSFADISHWLQNLILLCVYFSGKLKEK